MIAEIWFSYLYQPVFNALVWIYSNVADENLGWAVIILTIILRLLLLPLTIKSEKDAYKREKAEEEAIKKTKQLRNDFVARKEEIRKIMKKNKISPWAKMFSLGVQLLVLVLLYQVFIGGIEGHRVIVTLYEFVNYPGQLNSQFYGFDIGNAYNWLWASLPAAYLIISILWSNRDEGWDRSKVTFLLLFPLFTFLVLYFLPMVKSLFILTSMLFSDIMGVLLKPFFAPHKEEEKK